MPCDGYYESAGIPYEPAYADNAVYWTRSDPNLGWGEKKQLIICWFDTTYGEWNGSRYDMKDSRAQMSIFLKSTKYATFEELINDAGAI